MRDRQPEPKTTIAIVLVAVAAVGGLVLAWMGSAYRGGDDDGPSGLAQQPPTPGPGGASDRGGFRPCDPQGDFFLEGLDGCFAWIEGGSFLMGAQASDPAQPGYDPRARPDEGPPRMVAVDGFWVQRMEVQLQVYRRCVRSGACPEPELELPGYYRFGTQEHETSVNGVTWAEAQACCEYLGGRLPTEAEWEYLARGTQGWRFPWGVQLRCAEQARLSSSATVRSELAASGQPGLGDDEADALDCSLAEPPSSKPRRIDVRQGNTLTRELDPLQYSEAFGLCHLAGSTWEWVGDRYDADYYSSASSDNPSGPERGERRVQRGGGWLSSSVWEYRSANRAALDPELRMPDVGFRCVVPVETAPAGIPHYDPPGRPRSRSGRQ